MVLCYFFLECMVHNAVVVLADLSWLQMDQQDSDTHILVMQV